MIYLGDNWPDRYRDGVFMCNLHGNRINHDLLDATARLRRAHGKDFMLANDPWFRGIALKYGPDGGVYVTDWTDTANATRTTPTARTARTAGFSSSPFGKARPVKVDLAAANR